MCIDGVGFTELSVSLILMNHKRSLISKEQLTNGGGEVFH